MTSTLTARLALRLPSSPASVTSARHAMQTLAPRVSPGAIEDLELLTTEVVSNAVVHGSKSARGGIALDVFQFERLVRVEVRDQGPGFSQGATPAPPGPDSEWGRGLYLVDVLADRWGVSGEGSTLVWFEVAVDAVGADPDRNGSGPVGALAETGRETTSIFRRRAERRGLELS